LRILPVKGKNSFRIPEQFFSSRRELLNPRRELSKPRRELIKPRRGLKNWLLE